MHTESAPTSDRPAPRQLPNSALGAVVATGVAAVIGTGWWLFSSFGVGFFADYAASGVYTAMAVVFLVAAVTAAIGVARGRHFAWLAALSCCAATASAGVAHLVAGLSYGLPVNGLDVVIELVFLVPAAVSVVAIVLLGRSGVRDWCAPGTGVAWLFPALGPVIVGAVGAVVPDYPDNVVSGVAAAVAVLAGLLGFALARRGGGAPRTSRDLRARPASSGESAARS